MGGVKSIIPKRGPNCESDDFSVRVGNIRLTFKISRETAGPHSEVVPGPTRANGQRRRGIHPRPETGDGQQRGSDTYPGGGSAQIQDGRRHLQRSPRYWLAEGNSPASITPELRDRGRLPRQVKAIKKVCAFEG